MIEPRLAAAIVRSALDVDGSEIAALRDWIGAARAVPGGRVEARALSELDGWTIDVDRIAHRTGRFFAVAGLRATVAGEPPVSWEQPILLQPEVGMLGLLGRVRDGRLEVLVQAKWEPGNVGLVQASPSLQATVSNYTAAHGGRLPLLLEQFLDGVGGTGTPYGTVVFDTPQAEQGAIYLGKRNRNALRVVPPGAEPVVPDRFRWAGLAALQALATVPHALHLDARSILGSLPAIAAPTGAMGPSRPGSVGASAAAAVDAGDSTLDRILGWLDEVRSRRRPTAALLPLARLGGWRVVDGHLVGPGDGEFDVVGVRVEAPGREVASWDQPLVRRPPSATSLVLQVRGGLLHALVHARTEAGTASGALLAPTLQTGDRIPDAAADGLSALAEGSPSVLDVEQSDEGGRFLASRVRHRIVVVDEGTPVPVGPDRRWLTFRQLRTLAADADLLSMELRSLLAAIPLAWAPEDGAMWTS